MSGASAHFSHKTYRRIIFLLEYREKVHPMKSREFRFGQETKASYRFRGNEHQRATTTTISPTKNSIKPSEDPVHTQTQILMHPILT